MKQAKRKKSLDVVALDNESAASVRAELPDADYVEQLLAASAPASAPMSAPVSAPAVSQLDEVAVTVVAAAPASTDASIQLPAQCVLRDAVDYRQHLLEWAQINSVRVDVAAVERIDTAFMQVLLAFVRSRPRDSEPVVWLNVNSVFVEAARLLGLQSALAVPEIGAAA